MHIRLEKFNHAQREKRFYALRVTHTLFDDWCLQIEWGEIGQKGKEARRYWANKTAALNEFERLKALKLEDGYAVIPVQLGML